MVDYRERTEPVWRQLAQRPNSETAFREWVALSYPNNEPEIDYENLPNELFPNYSLGRHPVSNRFFRLFDPNYGLRGTGNPNAAIASNDLWPRYADFSDQPETPSIYLSFYDAWVYSRFLYWDGLSCHLPHEDQWECSAKYGFGWAQWDQAYWWGNDFDRDRDRERINCRETGNKKTLVPDSRRANPLTVIADPKEQGLIDMLGGLWEWCEDPCPNLGDSYRRHSAEMFADPSVARSLRGGSFYSSAFDARCSRRDHNDPSKAYRNFGCRVARAKP
jgi:formylglycine-generating enzyme required for sulfatase activity